MIVEDSSDLRAVLCIALESEGYQVLEAANGKEALDLLKTHAHPDLILLDLMMPVMNGWEFLAYQQAHEEIHHIPVVVCSAVEEFNLVDVAFVAKPINLSHLTQTVQRYSQP
jgi:CheY-like chemotaxis protein